MTKETMNIHEALSELKTLEKRIHKAINSGTFCLSNRHNNEKINGIEVKEYSAIMQGYYDKADDLIKRYNAIKKAVTLSNAVTTVEIDGIEYTIAEAIYMKNHGMDFYTLFHDAMASQYNLAITEIARNNGKTLEEKAEKYIVSMFGMKEGKTSSEEIEKAKAFYIEANTYEMVDPIGILDKINELDDKINKFNSKVDAALSVSNAVTTIEIEY